MPLLTDQSSRKTRPFTGPAAEPPRSVSSGTAARRPHQVGYNLGSRRAAVASARLGRAQLIAYSVSRTSHEANSVSCMGRHYRKVSLGARRTVCSNVAGIFRLAAVFTLICDHWELFSRFWS